MQNNTVLLAKKIESYHKNYIEEYLFAANRKQPTDMLSALRFFFGICLYQGRRDKISDRFYSILMELLSTYDLSAIPEFESTDYKKSRNSKSYLISNYKSFINSLHEAGLNKENDRLMIANVIAVSNRIWGKEKRNLIDYLVFQTKEGLIDQVYIFLNNIYSIGPKISGLLLRDLVQIYNLQTYIVSVENFSLLQPIDTWVHQVSREIGMVNKKRPYNGEGMEITKFCMANDINPIHYNEGAWYLGSQSYKIVLRQLQSVEIA